MRIAITGANGFIAKYLKEAFANASFLLLSRETPLALPQTKENIRNFNPTLAIHLAGQSRISSHLSDWNYFEDNFLSTYHFIEALKNCSDLKCVFFSSSAHVYGNQLNEVNEESETRPESFYGYTKLLSEKLLMEAGFPKLLIGRFYNVIGPGQKEGYVIADWIQKLKANPSQLEVANLSSIRGFIDVREVAQIVKMLLLNPPPARIEILNVAHKEQPLETVLKLLLQIIGAHPELIETKSENSFHGIKISTKKLNALIKIAPIPLQKTLTDMVN